MVGLIALGGFVYDFFTEAKRDESGQVVGAGELVADSFQVGDCLLLPEGVGVDEEFSFESLDAVPCSEGHDMEYFATVLYPGDDHPGDEALFTYGDEHCAPEFEEFTGVLLDHEARLVMSSFIPDEEAWSSGDREIGCVLFSYDGAALVGSQRDRGLLGFAGIELTRCYDVTETSSYVAFTEVACDRTHDIEYFGSAELNHGQDEGYPGDQPLNEFGEEECGTQYTGYVGRAWAPGSLPDYTWGSPTPDTWPQGDRLVQCFLIDPDGGRLDRAYRVEA